MATTTQAHQPSPTVIFDTLNAYQRSAALKAAIELEVFTAIAEGAEGRATANELAERSKTAPRGMRILCDYLVVMEFLTKVEARYGLTPESALYLDQRSPAYFGSAARTTSPGKTASSPRPFRWSQPTTGRTPARGIREIFRVLAPGGSAWILIEDYRDNLAHQLKMSSDSRTIGRACPARISRARAVVVARTGLNAPEKKRCLS